MLAGRLLAPGGGCGAAVNSFFCTAALCCALRFESRAFFFVIIAYLCPSRYLPANEFSDDARHRWDGGGAGYIELDRGVLVFWPAVAREATSGTHRMSVAFLVQVSSLWRCIFFVRLRQDLKAAAWFLFFFNSGRCHDVCLNFPVLRLRCVSFLTVVDTTLCACRSMYT